MNEKNTVTRRQFIQGTGAGVLVASGLAGHAARAATPSRPNFVFILADDLGYADLSCYGRRDYQTPQIDTLARDGLLLTDGYANSAVCSATRFALLSGRYQYRFQGGLYEPLNEMSSGQGFPSDHPTMASLLKQAGYGTTLVGKWHLGNLPDYGPLKCGYERFYGHYTSHVDYYTHEDTLPLTGKTDLFEDETPIEPEGYVTDLFGDRAVGEIERYARARQPFLLSLHFNAPHWPWMGPGEEGRKLSAGLKNIQHFDGGSLAIYAKMMRSLDDNVGKILAALDRNGLRDNTVVVFTSDNGGERFSDFWPFSGMKTELLEGGIRVATLVRWPARIRAGTRSEQQAMSMDWLPTFVAAAGGRPSPDHPLDGINLLPMLIGERPVQPRKLFWRYHAQNQEAMRDGRWKYLKINEHEFLFDLIEDPLERGNLKEREPAIFARLKSEYAQWNQGMLPYTEKTFSYSLTGGGRIAERSFK